MRSNPVLVLAALLVTLPLAPRAEEIRMIGQSVMYSNKSILSNVIDSRTHRTLIKAMKMVKLEQPLMRRGTFTVFAPDDAAFAALPQAHTPQSLLRVSRSEIARLLSCHIVSGNEMAGKPLSELVADSRTVELQTIGGCILTVSRKDDRFFVAGEDGVTAEITALDVAQSNGILEIIDRVLAPSL